MPRRKSVQRRSLNPDPKFDNALVTRFINSLLKDGKRSTAEGIFYSAMKHIESKTKTPSNEVFEKAIDNVKPYLEVKSRRIGGSNYQVPLEVRPERRKALAIRWILAFASARPGTSMAEKLALELIAASNNEGSSVKKKDDTHKMAEANKAFAHFRW
ncbi:MAG: 30S ribosomal protein S7 [candidate division Zixibacteria bacterium CG_4_9_14_3_um_filter_46_8]|nr:MAG: 30S ribosomal protein S7 [candidate division Zixibacteria bacterium CG_4_9_14_3_um_filter_46_8]